MQINLPCGVKKGDWLLRFYGFRAEELLDEENPNFNPLVDPKCSWARPSPPQSNCGESPPGGASTHQVFSLYR